MTQPALTLRAMITGVVIGALLTPCNIYSGLKIGWSFNMSIAALLLAFGVWRGLQRLLPLRSWEILESNINQTTASSAASIISGGLVAPIPALALIQGQNLPLLPLIVWVFVVSFLGIWVAWFLRKGLIQDAALPFPAGTATAETMRDMFSHGQAAVHKVLVLLSAGIAGAAVKVLDLVFTLPRWFPEIALAKGGVLAGAATLKKLTFAIEPSALLVGFGGIIGLRAGLSLALGAVLAWGVIAPWGIRNGWLQVGPDAVSWFSDLVEWLIWPGVSLMVAATLTSLAIRGVRRGAAGSSQRPHEPRESRGIIRFRHGGLLVAAVLAVVAQILIFDIHWTMALLAIPMAFLLASVAARVTGETGIPPIGAIGKVSQLGFGVVAPGQVVTNLMTANVAGGAAGQCADLLNDFKAGAAVGATPYTQVIAQCVGVLTGSIVGSLVYLLLIPDPVAMLLTEQWPAPAVATWKVVAETLQAGLGAVPLGARWALGLGAVAGILLALCDSFAPPSLARWLPSAPALGLAFVIPASISLTLCLGALLAFVLYRIKPQWAERYWLAVAAGLVAGESLAGVGGALVDMFY